MDNERETLSLHKRVSRAFFNNIVMVTTHAPTGHRKIIAHHLLLIPQKYITFAAWIQTLYRAS